MNQLTAKKKLHLGCGSDIRPDYVNLDRVALPGVDVVRDIEALPLPFADGSFEEILCQDVLEHCTHLVEVVRDLHRLLVPGGKLRIRVPHFTSKNAYTDPTHRSFFAFRTFYFFTKNSLKGRSYYFDFSFASASVALTFEQSSRWFFYNRLVAPLVNTSDRARYFFESTFLSRLFPAENIMCVLTK